MRDKIFLHFSFVIFKSKNKMYFVVSFFNEESRGDVQIVYRREIFGVLRKNYFVEGVICNGFVDRFILVNMIIFIWS